MHTMTDEQIQMDWPSAMKALQQGLCVCRGGWNGPGQYVGLQNPDSNSANRQPYLWLMPVNGLRVPWVPSTGDLLATDWQIYNEVDHARDPRVRRTINSHKVNGCNEVIELQVLDDPGSGGACHDYRIVIDNALSTRIKFQNGPINEVGTNGLTHEVLLAIVIDRLEAFQSGPYACPENGEALLALKHAQTALQSRTKKRLARGVEGTHAK